MRFQLVDKILGFEKNKSIVGVKGISLQADNFEPFRSKPYIYPPTLCLESLAQLGGWLTSASFDFAYLPVLGMITGVVIDKKVSVGECMLLKAELIQRIDTDCTVKGEILQNGEAIIKVKRITYGLIKINDQVGVDNRKVFQGLFLTPIDI